MHKVFSAFKESTRAYYFYRNLKYIITQFLSFWLTFHNQISLFSYKLLKLLFQNHNNTYPIPVMLLTILLFYYIDIALLLLWYCVNIISNLLDDFICML